jgi:hypothetical protein
MVRPSNGRVRRLHARGLRAFSSQLADGRHLGGRVVHIEICKAINAHQHDDAVGVDRGRKDAAYRKAQGDDKQCLKSQEKRIYVHRVLRAPWGESMAGME